MANDSDDERISLGYALGQLARALAGAGKHVARWQKVVEGMLSGKLQVGSRTPVAAVPPWVTLEVVHGGFATGNLAAAGALQPHELETLRALGHVDPPPDRTILNTHYLGAQGRQDLLERLRTGRFRIDVPEEAALVTVAWLIDEGQPEAAAGLIDVLVPFFDRLRFYPSSTSAPVREATGVHLDSVGTVVEALRSKRQSAQVERMKEAVLVWTPLYDRAAALFLETVEGPPPRLRADASGAWVRNASGNPIVDGGWPCRHFAADWNDRARALLAEYAVARGQHSLCKKPERRKENFARLRAALALCIDDPAKLSGRDVGMIRKVLASYVSRHGLPGSSELTTTRADQHRNASAPSHHALAKVVASRFEACASDEGDALAEQRLGPLTAEESARFGLPSAAPMPRRFATTALRCLEAPIEALVAKGLVSSCETLARVLPELTARARAAAIDDPDLQRLYRAVYVAFRKRRSLLLLDLASQVQLHELPWVAAVVPWVGGDDTSRAAARAVMTRVVCLALETFPHTIFPNKLVKELRSLAMAADEPMTLTDELAADIFMGMFASNYLSAAQTAGRMLQGRLYERYFGLDYASVLALDDVVAPHAGPPTSAGFAAMCKALAGPEVRGTVAGNGAILEQSQILTTHNLAVLFESLALRDRLGPELPALARSCFRWVCRRQQQTIRDWRARLHNVKNSAYAWRQMIFFLSLCDESQLHEFLAWARVHFAEQREHFRTRFEPALRGLELVVNGESFDARGVHARTSARRFLGWSAGRHWLLSDRASV